MVVHTFHLARPGLITMVGALVRPPTSAAVPGLQHAECMMPMRLGASLFSPGRWRIGRLAMFAAWDDEASIDAFLQRNRLGRALAKGWHVRLQFLRRWGSVAAFDPLPAKAGETDLDAPVVAVTVARMKLLQVPRFIRWGVPVERLVRDHPGTTLALAAMRPVGTVATFSVWKSAREMIDMVHGHSAIAAPERHAVAMVERRRKDFHFEFTTLRFHCIGEYGAWEGRSAIVPTQRLVPMLPEAIGSAVCVLSADATQRSRAD
jgi:hypothetical protein